MPTSPARRYGSIGPLQEGGREGRDRRVPILLARLRPTVIGVLVFHGDAEQPDRRAVDDQVLRRLEAALKPPSRVGIDGSGATPRDGAGV